mmetsp:Transcript_16545/g.30099  ORF Transcript_16545/g.30099 Transcript_16545/m.30099 type:complete len:529 (-) Transcript_16545:32-1618(-)
MKSLWKQLPPLLHHSMSFLIFASILIIHTSFARTRSVAYVHPSRKLGLQIRPDEKNNGSLLRWSRPSGSFHRWHPFLGNKQTVQSFVMKMTQQNDSANRPTVQETDITAIPSSENMPLTSMVLNITYEGTHVHGWSAPNEGQLLEEKKKERNGADFLAPITLTKLSRRKRRTKRHDNVPIILDGHKVRTVQGIVRKAFAKLYGNVDPNRIHVEGCSRTDRGVHARSLIALVYCLTEDAMVPFQTAEAEGPIPGKYLPHPINATDHSSFLPIPSDGRLGLILFKLNRIFPPDVRVSAISPMPMPTTITTTRPSSVLSKDDIQPFHPSLDSMGKKYRYTFSTGDIHDPLRWRHVWHLEDGSVFNLDRARQVIPIMLGCNNLAAFESMARGKRRNDTICTIADVIIVKEESGDYDGPSGAFDQMHSLAPEFTIGMRPVQDVSSSKPLETFSIEITGDRFLYKMARNLVGAIVAIGKGQVELTDVQKALQNGEWDSSIKKRPVCAPAHGLILQHVVYPNNMSFDWVNQPEAK